MKSTILFFCEAVTLSHVVQSVVLAKHIQDKYNVIFACCPDRNGEIKKAGFKCIDIFTQSSETFAKKLYTGKVIFPQKIIDRYLKEEISILERIKPAIVIGDFRITLKISSKICQVTYLSINNFYWSKHCDQKMFYLPDIVFKKYFGEKIGKMIFNLLLPIASKFYLRPFQNTCKKYGIKAPKNLKEMYCDGDYVLYGDVKELFPEKKIPDTQVFIGPILWEPEIDLPETITKSNKEMIYYSPGSSGREDKKILKALTSFDGIVIITKANKNINFTPSKNMLIFDYLPAIKLSKMKNLILAITNGGVSSYTFLKDGVPVFTSPSNMYQCLFSSCLRKHSLGVLKSKKQLTAFLDTRNKKTTFNIKKSFKKYNQKKIFLNLLEKLI